MNIRPMCAVLLLTLSTCIAIAQQSASEVAVWKLEHSYWDDVKTLDLVSYRALWYPDFVGWPYVSPAPQRKDHITDWLDQFTTKGQRLKSYSLKPAASHATGDIVITYYWLTATWGDKTTNTTPQTSRITHTWLKTPTGWQILGGMSSQQPEDKK